MAKRAGLGRGLGALLGETAGEVHAEQKDAAALRELPVEDVVPNPNQPRRSFGEEDLEELADSIRKNGILQPIVVRPYEGSYQIIAGERRYQAALRAGINTVPAVVREVSDKEMLQLALIENLQREDLNPLEAARGYKDLMEKYGLTQEELSQILSKSRSSIANALRLLDLPDAVQELLMDGKLTAGHARAILSVHGEDARVALAEKVVAEGLSVRQTEILGPLFSVKEQGKSSSRAPRPQAYKDAARVLRDKLTARVTVRSVRGRNKIEIDFDDEDELNSLVSKILGA
ncbi:MAG: ParB/RepB/Spo0J family partition protein [Atopobiaceae bacterium]|jgi:ParB family chromosome partitioning protein|nr:ParB/RepB/Spo0J family partition protein [Atopobiaceae bacterium]